MRVPWGAYIPARAVETPRGRTNLEGRPETPDPGSKGEEMATTTARPAALDPQQNGAHKASLTADDRCALLRYMLLMRATEERALTLYRQGKVPGCYYDGRGQEAVSVGSAFALGPRDRACILHRDLGAHLVRGVKPGRVLAQMMGRAGGVTGGRDGNMHFGDRELGCVGHGLDAARHGARGLRAGAGVPDARRAARGDDLVRRRLDRQRPVARGDERRRRAQAAGRLRPREQPVRLLDPQRPRVRGRPGRARRDLRLPGREGRRQRRRGRVRGRRRGVRARPRGRRPDADRGRDDAHARPRRARRHALRAGGDARGVVAARPDRDLRGAAARRRHRRRRDPRRRWPRSSSARPSGRWRSRCPTRRRPPTACSPTEDPVLGDGQAPWSRWRGGGVANG